ncbi:hypothetical protein NQ314_002912 [Rhamnusium bicolor]|uniref:Rabenosyn-5 n=1 Tax=Rhamnusium bicolor TaxID=1586634 RepID=A0AAV8ZN91_9CUCU|nr:hypothetical protein NQ314_002912 [Rhamnusium bicolor]
MAEANTIQEGFLCPMCHKDLRSPNNLIVHFQDLHSEEQDILKSIKDIYDKYYLEYSDPQEPGPTRSHTDYFRAVRRERLDHRTTETNKLIIRLDRLLRFYGSDRKQQEQELVTWVEGYLVSRCPACTLPFNIARRQHHCRLCGSIMCNSCSYFLPYEIAQTIVAPVNNGSDREPATGKEGDNLRICNHCWNMLDCRRRVQIEQMKQPIICQLYSHLQKNKFHIQNTVDMYEKMYNSLVSGETTYLLQDLQSLRTTIADKAQMIDTLSKKIALLPVDPGMPKAAALQNNIRKATSVYIKDYLLTLSAPPTVQELEKIKRNRSIGVVEDDIPTPKPSIKKVTVTTGWSPANVTNETTVVEENDPLLEQMNIVRNYIDQARKAQRFEEVASLQENLQLLKKMYREQQKEEYGKK